MLTKHTIPHRDGGVIFEHKCDSFSQCVEAAVRRGVSLAGADLRWADLRGANLRWADLRGADLWGAKLRGADLAGADLAGANFRGANLREADLRWAKLSGAKLSGVDLSGVNLRKADLRGAHLAEGAMIDAGEDHRGYRFVAHRRDGTVYVAAGCRYLPLPEARAHWQSRHEGNPALRAECLAKLDLIEAIARARGWLDAPEEDAP